MDHSIEHITVKVEIIENDEDSSLYYNREESDLNTDNYNPQNNQTDCLKGENDSEIVKPLNNDVDAAYCEICNKKFKSRNNLKQHMKHIHTNEAAVECSECYRTFKSHAHLKSHADCAHPKPGMEIECDECGKVFVNPKKLGNHKYYTHAGPGEKVFCKICNKAFTKKYKLKVHIRQVHSSHRTATCDECGKVFKNEMLLKRHESWSHPVNTNTHKCEDCGKTFPTKKHYRKHKEEVHSLPDGVTCDLCQRVLANKKSLARHLNTHSKGKVFTKPAIGPLACTICDRRFTTNTALYWHKEKDHSENIQIGNKKKCHICLKEYTDHHVLRRHLESIHSIETATCDLCHKTFKSPMNLKSHMRTTHAPPEAAQTCKICGKTFKCGMHLRIHISAVHPKNGGAVCEVCNRSFVSKRYLHSHKKIHVDEKRFECDVCGKTFKRKMDLGKHVKTVHKKKWAPLSKCLKCERLFTDEELAKHIVNCEGGDEEKLLPVIKIEVTEE